MDIKLDGIVDMSTGIKQRQKFIAAAERATSSKVVVDKRKSEKIAKWRQALIESEEASSEHCADEGKNDIGIVDLTSDPVMKEDEIPLFIIDRQGIDDTSLFVIESGSDEIIHNTVETSKTKTSLIENDDRILTHDDCDTASIDETDSADPMLGFKCRTREEFTSPHSIAEEPEVSFVKIATTSNSAHGNSMRTRKIVINALHRLGRKLRRDCTFVRADTVEVRQHARVPIVSFKTRYGFESDILIREGEIIDTSAYAASQVNRFRRYVISSLSFPN